MQFNVNGAKRVRILFYLQSKYSCPFLFKELQLFMFTPPVDTNNTDAVLLSAFCDLLRLKLQSWGGIIHMLP